MATVRPAGLTGDEWNPVAMVSTPTVIRDVPGWRRVTAHTGSALVRPVVLDGGHSSGHGRDRSGAGPDLGDHAGGHGSPDDVVAAVVLSGDAVQALHVRRCRACGRAVLVRRRRQGIGHGSHLRVIDSFTGIVVKPPPGSFVLFPGQVSRGHLGQAWIGLECNELQCFGIPFIP